MTVALTERQAEVLACLVQGLTYDEIAAELGISNSAVKQNVRLIRVKAGGVKRGRELIRWAQEQAT